MAAQHWHATEQAALGQWTLRASGGFTGRANSALPLGDPGLPLDAAVQEVTAWYAARGLPAMIAIPGPLHGAGEAALLDQFLAGRGWPVRSVHVAVMTAATAEVAGPPAAAVQLADQPDAEWLSLYHFLGQPLAAAQRADALALLRSAPWQAFARVWRDGVIAAIGRVSVAAGWAGLTAIEVAPACRRAGLGTAVTTALTAAAAQRGAGQVFLQVEQSNEAAISLYARLGFRMAHQYHFRVAPVSPS